LSTTSSPTTVTVTVKYSDGQPVPDYPFTLSAYVRDNSGGHDHSANRPTGRFIKSKDTVTTFSDKTGSDGTVAYRYLCSGFGGVDSLRVKGITEEDTASAIVLLKVNGLEELGAGDHYKLIGAYGTAGVKSEHRINHCGTTTLVSKLKALADSVYNDKKCFIRINDMSLPSGGPFDIANNWDTPHQTHREGVSADIDNEVETAEGTRKAISSTQFTTWLKKVVDDPKPGYEGDHFHLTIN
jgi:hypothetical protein